MVDDLSTLAGGLGRGAESIVGLGLSYSAYNTLSISWQPNLGFLTSDASQVCALLSHGGPERKPTLTLQSWFRLNAP